MGFKLKLVVYFLFLSLVLLGALFAAFGTVLARNETRAVDAQLHAGLRAATADYAEQIAWSEQLARELATDARVRRALADGDLRELREFVAATPGLRIEPTGAPDLGPVHAHAVERSATVLGGDEKTLGRVVAVVPLDERLAHSLRVSAGLRPGQRLAVLLSGRIVAAAPELGGRVALSGEPATVEVGGRSFRALAENAPGPDDGVEIAVLSPQEWIDAGRRSVWLRLLGALAVALVLVAVVAYAFGSAPIARLRALVETSHRLAAGDLAARVPVAGGDEFSQLGHAFNRMAEQLEARLGELREGRVRLRDATLRFGEALSSTHDTDQLLRSIAETAVELTRAEGGRLTAAGGRIVEVGRADAGPARLQLPLEAGGTSFGSLELRAREFSIQDLESVSLLLGHAVVALENARLHRIVERQALVDAVTGLSNRRAAEQSLAAELARSRRFGSPLSVVLADLDHFKDVNDRFGHPVGDLVLREFATVLATSLREGDLAARWGGEEFCLILPGTDAAGAATLAERVRTAMEERTILTAEGTPVRVTASFGVASRPPLATTDELVAAADTALYDAKRAGRNFVAVATTPGLPAPGERRLDTKSV